MRGRGEAAAVTEGQTSALNRKSFEKTRLCKETAGGVGCRLLPHTFFNHGGPCLTLGGAAEETDAVNHMALEHLARHGRGRRARGERQRRRRRVAVGVPDNARHNNELMTRTKIIRG